MKLILTFFILLVTNILSVTRVCGDGTCNAEEEMYCPIDCPGYAGTSNFTINSLFNNIQKSGYSGLAAIKLLTKTDLSVSYTTTNYLYGKRLDGSWTVTTGYEMNTKTNFDNKTPCNLQTVTITNNFVLFVPKCTSNCEYFFRYGVVGDDIGNPNPYKDASFNSKIPIFIVGMNDWWTNLGYNNESDAAKSARVVSMRYAVQCENDEPSYRAMRMNYLAMEVLRNAQAATIFRLLATDLYGAGNWGSSGMGITGFSKNGWGVFLSAFFDDRIRVMHPGGFQQADYLNATNLNVYNDYACDRCNLGSEFTCVQEALDRQLEETRLMYFYKSGIAYQRIYSPSILLQYATLTASTIGIGFGKGTIGTHDSVYNAGPFTKFVDTIFKPYCTVNSKELRLYERTTPPPGYTETMLDMVYLLGISKFYLDGNMDTYVKFKNLAVTTTIQGSNTIYTFTATWKGTASITAGNYIMNICTGINPVPDPKDRVWNKLDESTNCEIIQMSYIGVDGDG